MACRGLHYKRNLQVDSLLTIFLFISLLLLVITKTCLHVYNFDTLIPHFYIVKLGFTGVYIIFLILLKNIDCGYSLEPPCRSVLTVPTFYDLSSNMKNIRVFYLKIFSFFGGKIFNIFE